MSTEQHEKEVMNAKRLAHMALNAIKEDASDATVNLDRWESEDALGMVMNVMAFQHQVSILETLRKISDAGLTVKEVRTGQVIHE